MLYSKPGSLDAAVLALRQDAARPLAGGTDLLVRLGRDEAWPAGLVDLKGLTELRIREREDGTLRLGAGLTLAELLAAPETADYPALREACRVFAARQIRERATLGGNLANASPAADTVPSLVAYGAVCHSDRRSLPVEELATGPGRTLLADDEIIVHLTLPRPSAACRSFYHKLAQRDAMAVAVVSVACALELEGDRVRNVRIALGAVAPTVIRARAAEELLEDGPLSHDRIAAAADAAMTAARPIDDIRGSASYRRLMVGRLLRYHLSRLAASQ